MKNIFGGLLEFETTEEFDEFIKNMDSSSALKILELAIDYGQKNGLYELKEAFLLYNCIQKLNKTNE